MVLYLSIFLKSESVGDRFVVMISLVIIRKPSGKMSRDKTQLRIRVVKADCTPALVTGNA